MALTHQWTRQNFGPAVHSGWLSNVFVNLDSLVSPGRDWILLRTLVQVTINIQVNSSSTTHAAFPGSTMCMLGVKWNPALVDPGMDVKDESEQVIGFQLLESTVTAGPAGSNTTYVNYRQPSPFDVKTSRKPPAGGFPTLWSYLHFMDGFGDLAAGNVGPSIFISSRLDALWGHH